MGEGEAQVGLRAGRLPTGFSRGLWLPSHWLDLSSLDQGRQVKGSAGFEIPDPTGDLGLDLRGAGVIKA